MLFQMSLRPRRVVSLFLFVLASSCGTSEPQKSTVQDLAHNADTRNLALFFTAPRPVGNTRVYIDNDPERIMESLVSLDQRFTHFTSEVATSRIVSSWLREKLTPDNLAADGTLFVYIAGHGSPQGSAQMADGTFVNFRTIIDGIRAARPGQPVKRLVLMVFGCYSGSWINHVRGTDYSDAAEQIFVITSSAANQLSYSGGTNSQLATAFHATMAAHAANRSGITLRQFGDGIRARVQSSTPQYFAKPESLLNETLFSQRVLETWMRTTAK